MRLLDRLDADALRRDPKPLCGFSDATALLAWALRAGVRGVHAPVVVQLPRLPPREVEWMFEVIEGRAPLGAPVARGMAPTGAPASGRVEGPLLGGNLCLMAHLVGTPAAIDYQGAVVLIEEVDEKPYALDRYLTRMAQAGALAGARAALVGDFTRCVDEKYPRPDAVTVVAERLASFGLGGLGGAPIGHGDRNLAVSFGGRVALDLGAGTLELLDPAAE
jgi:muramoyltetrapeptide carboxypeptidase